MTESLQKIPLTRSETSPDRVIEHLVALVGFAERHGFPAFEASLMDAAEAFLREMDATGSWPRDPARPPLPKPAAPRLQEPALRLVPGGGDG